MAKARTLKNIDSKKDYLLFAFLTRYIYMIRCNNVSKSRLNNYQINSKLIGSNIYRKKNMANNDDR